MSSNFQLQLNSSSIHKVPFNTYDPFTFVINGELFKTNKIVADLLSSEVCKIHSADPTINQITIKTENKGNFKYYLNLANFDIIDIPEEEIPFISEITQILGIDTSELSILDFSPKITISNALELLQKHEKSSNFYSNIIKKEIDFISTHLFEICQLVKEEEFMKISLESLEEIIKNPNLHICNEDQLLSLINCLYLNDNEYSFLYQYVIFANVSQEAICFFLNIYDMNYMNKAIWDALSSRLCHKIDIQNKQDELKSNYRYKLNEIIKFSYEKGKEFNGIINYLLEQSNNDIDEIIDISAFSVSGDNNPKNVTIFNDNQKYYYSLNKSNQWICFDFRNNKIIPTNYTIRSLKSSCNLKSWILEGSNDNSQWVIIDEKKSHDYFKDDIKTMTFNISYPTSTAFRYVRIRQILNNNNNDVMAITSLEFYGTLIYKF